MKKTFWVLLALLTCVFALGGCSGTKATIDFEKCVSVSFSGFNGEGSAVINPDAGYVLSLLGDLNSLTATQLVASFTFADIENNGKLSNGDVVNVKVNTNAELLKSAKVAVKNTELSFTVSGLEEKPKADVFKDVSLKVTGSSPYCKVSVEYTGDLPISSYSFEISTNQDGQKNYKDGDAVKVVLNENDAKMLSQNYVISETEKEYTVKADSVLILTVDDLTAERKTKLDEVVQKNLDEQIQKILNNTGAASSKIMSNITNYDAISVESSGKGIQSIDNVQLNSAYIGTTVEKELFSTKEKHYIYYFYDADFTHNYKSEETVHAILLLRFTDPAETNGEITFSNVETGARKDIDTVLNTFISDSFSKLM